MKLPEEREKWNTQQHFEPHERYAAYVAYRDMGPGRSTGALSDKPGMPKPSVLDQWAYRWRWRDRAEQWDDDNALSDVSLSQDEVKQARALLNVLGRRLGAKCREAIEGLNPGAIRPSTIPNLAKAAKELILAGNDLPTEVTETRIGGQLSSLIDDLKGLRDDQLVAFRDLLRDLSRAGEEPAPGARGGAVGPTDGGPH